MHGKQILSSYENKHGTKSQNIRRQPFRSLYNTKSVGYRGLSKLSKHKEAASYYESTIKTLTQSEGAIHTAWPASERQKCLEDARTSLVEEGKKEAQKAGKAERVGKGVTRTEKEATITRKDDMKETLKFQVNEPQSEVGMPPPVKLSASSRSCATLATGPDAGDRESATLRGRRHSTDIHRTDLENTLTTGLQARPRSVSHMPGHMIEIVERLGRVESEDGIVPKRADPPSNFTKPKRVDSAVVAESGFTIAGVGLQEGYRAKKCASTDAEVGTTVASPNISLAEDTPHCVSEVPKQSSNRRDMAVTSSLEHLAMKDTATVPARSNLECVEWRGRLRRPGLRDHEDKEEEEAQMPNVLGEMAPSLLNSSQGTVDPTKGVPMIRVHSSDTEEDKTMPGQWPRESRRRAQFLVPRPGRLLDPAASVVKQRRASCANPPQEAKSCTLSDATIATDSWFDDLRLEVHAMLNKHEGDDHMPRRSERRVRIAIIDSGVAKSPANGPVPVLMKSPRFKKGLQLIRPCRGMTIPRDMEHMLQA
ncbi:hypothetical protein CC86DRAFT_384535 [Ophiobolus disseminans]|uniref:Uncharacterized protein n=1 Tax=Ophiobolus disseminans TaxID=1469910 RepID=A0A6A6ZUM0_9PLEO|nr:hypothetical protein CC86DRAFT_384535 [Ophiobolus disseminans]